MLNQRRRVTRKKIDIPTKYVFSGVVIFCIVAIFVSLNLNISGGPFKTVAETVFGPMQKGLNYIGSYMVGQKHYFDSLEELKAENEALRKENEELTVENSTLKLEHYELENLRQLYDLDNKYPSYEKTAARVIARDAGNWFDTFIIDKGSEDGIEVDMNVIMTAAGELVEVQGTAEGKPFSRARLNELLDLAEYGLKNIFERQREILESVK